MKGAYIIEPNQGLKFPGVEYVKDKVMKYGVYQQPTRAVILNARHLAGTDYSAVQGITQLYEYFTKHNYTLVIACATVSYSSQFYRLFTCGDSVPNAIPPFLPTV